MIRWASSVLLATAALASPGCGNARTETAPESSGPAVEMENGWATPYGSGAAEVWILRPREGPSRRMVVYLHGYGAYLPFEWHARWMDHMLENGSVVMFPRYQERDAEDPLDTPLGLAEGLRTGFAAAKYDGERIVVAGFSLGATLAFVYAARAREWDVPSPDTVYAIFPVHPMRVDPQLDLSTIQDADVLILAGADDYVVGREGARALASGLDKLPRPRKELHVIESTESLFADHEAPTRVDDPRVRETFWTPLDDLIVEASQ